MKKKLENIEITSLTFSFVKDFFSHKTYLQLIVPFLGWIEFLKNRKVLKISISLLVMGVFSFIGIVFKKPNMITLLKNFQFIGLVLFLTWGVENLSKEKILKLINIVEIVSIVFHIFDKFIFRSNDVRDMLGYSFQRYNGIVGEPNYSALLYLVFLIINFENKRYKNIIVDFLLIISTFSRMSIILIPIYLIFKFLQIKLTYNVKKILFGLIFILNILYPQLVYKSWDYLSDEIKLTIAEKSADRYIIHAVYVDLYKYSIIGSGFGRFNETFNFEIIPDKYHNVIKLKKQNYTRKQQHNTLIQVITEFGVLGYLFYISFLGAFYYFISKYNETLLPSFVILIMAQQFLNTLSEIGIYIFYIYIIFELLNNDKFKISYLQWKYREK